MYRFPVYTIFDFSYVFCQCHILIFASGEQIRSNLKVKLHKMCLRVQGQLVESEKSKKQTKKKKHVLKWAHPL